MGADTNSFASPVVVLTRSRNAVKVTTVMKGFRINSLAQPRTRGTAADHSPAVYGNSQRCASLSIVLCIIKYLTGPADVGFNS
jgi:hypothetical protein